MKTQLLSLGLLFLALQASNAQEALQWWEDSSLYHVYVRSFKDTNGDGVGDLNGVTSELEYFKEIGITAIWLAPIFKSPMEDMGYDVSDYKDIDPLFGTLDDFDNLIEKANRLDIKVILDMVLNHASTENELFKKSANREPGYENLFVWEDGKPDPNNSSQRLPPCNWRAVFGGSAWQWHEGRQQYYLHLFGVTQVDFNWRNQQVIDLWNDIFIYWLGKGAKGLRLDATNYLIEHLNEDGSYPDSPTDTDYIKDQPENYEMMYKIRKLMDDYKAKNGGDEIPLYSEAYGKLELLKPYYTDGTQLGVQVPFNFDFVRTIRDAPKVPKDLNVNSNAADIEYMVNRWMDLMWNDTKTANWQVGNHDNPRVTTRMGPKRTDIVNMLIAALPGISVTYYGEEVGMLDGITSDDFRDGCRSPMQWDSSSTAGFSTSSEPWLPLSSKHETLNVERERGVSRSTLNVYKAMHKLKKTPAFKAYKEPGALEYGALNDNVYQIVRSLPGKVEYRILLNFGNKMELLSNLSNKVMTYDVLNSYSPHRQGEKVDLNKNLYLMPYEGIVLHWSS